MGRLDRIILIQCRTVTRDSWGGEIETWVKLDTVWAEKVQVKPSERFITNSATTVNKTTSRLRILARADVDETMRVIDGTRTWGIIGIIKNNRHDMTLLLEVEPSIPDVTLEVEIAP